jgi:hypothetical protein
MPDMAASPAPDRDAPVQVPDTAGALIMPAASAQLALATWQRAVALQAEWFEETLRRARNHREVPTLQRPLTDWTEPALRYATGLMALGRSTQDQWVCLSSASLRGARAEVLRLANEAREQASLASHEAGSAAQSAWSCWLQGLQISPPPSSTAPPAGRRHDGASLRPVTRAARPRTAPSPTGPRVRGMTAPG